MCSHVEDLFLESYLFPVLVNIVLIITRFYNCPPRYSCKIFIVYMFHLNLYSIWNLFLNIMQDWDPNLFSSRWIANCSRISHFKMYFIFTSLKHILYLLNCFKNDIYFWCLHSLLLVCLWQPHKCLVIVVLHYVHTCKKAIL